MAFLATEALCFRHGDALESDLLKRFFHFVEFERFDDRLYFFHRLSFPEPVLSLAISVRLVVFGALDWSTRFEKRRIQNSV